jgi:hypothetical protein
MRYFWFLLFLFAGLKLTGQNQAGTIEGAVTYITSQSVYVHFSSTDKIRPGDTLFILQGQNLIPALTVKDLSSMSCVCTPVSSITFKIGDKITFRSTKKVAAAKPATATVPPAPAVSSPPPAPAAKPDSTGTTRYAKPTSRQQIHGYAGLASYSNFSSSPSMNSQSEKLTFSLTARNLGNTNLSAECFLTYYENPNQLNEISNSVFNKLKIYDLAVIYDFGKTATLSLGRKLNPRLSNMGSNDGLQFEWKLKPVSIGVIAGFRPDYRDYGFNASLFQFGTYLYNEMAGDAGVMQTTLAFIDQTNSGKTDRRFFYFQHVNSLVKNLTLFASFEVAIYGKQFNSADSTYKTVNTANLNNLFISLSYRLLKRLGITFSYSNRQNVIYYETYKNYLDRLLDNPTLQGYSLQVNYSPVTNLSLGATASYRFEKPDPNATKNIYAYVTYSQIPAIKTAATVSYMQLETSYVNGKIYSAGLSKDLFTGKLYLGLTYRYVDYHYYNTEEIPSYQNMAEFSLTWRIIRKLLFSAYYEGTFEKQDKFHRIYAQIHMGF